MKRKSKSTPLKQTTLFQYSSPTKHPPSSFAQKYRADSDSDGIQGIKLEQASSSSYDSSSSSSEDGENDVPVRTPGRAKARRNAIKSDSEDSDNTPLNVVQRRRAVKSKRSMRLVESEENEDEQAPETKRRRLTRTRTIVVNEKTDEDSSQEDLDSDCIIESRFRARKQTQFQKNLEKLKKRKQKKTTLGKTPSEDSDSDEDGSADESPSSPKAFRGAKPSKMKKDSLFGSGDEGSQGDENSDEESAESDFIVEDNPMAAPVLPAQFSMESHEDMGHQFKKVFQLFTHVAVHPPKKRKRVMETLLEDEYFSVPLTMMRRKLSGLRDSLVASSVWRPEFIKALERFPEFELTFLDFSVPGCDACHLGSRTSTRRGAVSGVPYDKLGFRDQKTSSRSDSDTDSDSLEHLKKQFDLGRFCARRTDVFHQFCHWEYATFQAVEREIAQVRTSRKEKAKGKGKVFYQVAYAGGKAPPEDLTDADGFCEWLDERGFIDMEWKRVKGMTDSARDLEMLSKRGEKD